MATLFEGMPGARKTPEKISVSDAKCVKLADAIYDCEVLFTYPSLEGQTAHDRYKFTKLGGTWQAQHVQ